MSTLKAVSHVFLLATVAVALCLAHPNHGPGAGHGPPDPKCKRGLYRWRACCPKVCGVCGGKGCWARGRSRGVKCCTAPIRALPKCTQRGPPCSFVGLPTPAPKPKPKKPKQPKQPKQPAAGGGGGGKFSSTMGRWRTAPVKSGRLVRRHEACTVMYGGKVYLVGGRGVAKKVSVYDPKAKTWTNKPGFKGEEIHHMQCVVADGKVWILASWTGKYPFERNNKSGYLYDIATGKWSKLPGMPPARNRAGSAVVKRGDFMYVVAGNRGGHGAHAITLGWMDAFNWRKRKWVTGVKYPDLPVPRDHTGGAMVGGRLCVAGGRDGGHKAFFYKNTQEAFCFSFKTFKWQRVQNMPLPRGGSQIGPVCGGLMVAGGEGRGQAYKQVHVFNGKKWIRGPNMVEARHGSGLAAAKCSCGHVFVPSGSGRQGGSPELFTTEEFIPKGSPNICASY